MTSARAALYLNLFLVHPPPWVKKRALKVNIFSSKMYMSASFNSYNFRPKVLIVHGPQKTLQQNTSPDNGNAQVPCLLLFHPTAPNHFGGLSMAITNWPTSERVGPPGTTSNQNSAEHTSWFPTSAINDKNGSL